jgi:hypothetical protein
MDGWEGVRYFNRIGRPFPSIAVIFYTLGTRASRRPPTRRCATHGDGFGSDTHGYEFGCHCLPHFISNSDTNTNIIEYEYKADILNSDSYSNTYSIYSIES